MKPSFPRGTGTYGETPLHGSLVDAYTVHVLLMSCPYGAALKCAENMMSSHRCTLFGLVFEQ